MVVTFSNVDTELWSEVRTKIIAGLSADGVSASVEAVYNGKKNTKPVVVIEPIAEANTLDKFGDNNGMSNIVVNIYCYSNKTTLVVDTVALSVKNALKLDDIDGVSYQGTSTSYDFQELNDTPYHMKNLSVSYRLE